MDKMEQGKTIIELCDNLKIATLSKLERIPANWDEDELKQYIEDKAAQFNAIKMTRTRIKNYKNDIKVNWL